MKITPEEVAHVAALARLRLSPEQSAKLTGQINDILTHMDKLGELDTSGVPSTNHALELTGAMRPDVARPSLPRQEGLANAPQSDGVSFIVPRVI
ncbi:MAG: Asp-tRNA(Asn)/Glu-tRNA(Gln) amidotransferase subunit GatC [Pseudomonadota bacterium]